jgi:hypothetical protein
MTPSVEHSDEAPWSAPVSETALILGGLVAGVGIVLALYLIRRFLKAHPELPAQPDHTTRVP